MIVVDTDVLIDHFRGRIEARTYIQSLSVGQRATTIITLMELFRGASNKGELERIEAFLERNVFLVLPVTASSSHKSVQLLKEYGLSNGLSIPDALIAGVVWEHDCQLVSGNLRHFVFLEELSVSLPPYRSS